MVALSVDFVLDFSCSTPLRHAGRGSAVEERVFEIKSQLMSAKYKWKLLTRPNTHTVTGSHTHTRTLLQSCGSLSMKQRKINKPNDVKRQLAGRTRTNIHTDITLYNLYACVWGGCRHVQSLWRQRPFNAKREKRKTTKITTVDGGDDPRKTLTHAIRVSKRARETESKS